MVVKNGDTIKVNYTGTLNDGTVFDSNESADKPSLEFKVGSGQLIKGFDEAVVGMNIGDVKNIKLKPEEAYGERRQDLIQKVPTERIPDEVKKSSVVGVKTQDGQTMNAIVLEKESDYTILDLNHPLAGRELNFKITVVEIN